MGATLTVLTLSGAVWAQQAVTVRTDRWLTLRQVQGTVTFQPSSSGTRAAQVGDRLQSVGDGLTTGRQSSARLEVDTGVGFVNVEESTQLRIRTLAVAPDNGRITHIDVPYGQVRLQIRTFTHEGSDLEIRTPAGVAGVRGTDFGVNVQPDGKMGIATLEGAVDTAAQGQSVLVPAATQNLTIPGEPPSPPVPLTDSTELTYRISRTVDGRTRRMRLLGQVDPVNLVLVNDVPQVTDRNGSFSVELPVRNRIRVRVAVITPLGKRQDYELAVL